MKLKRGQKPANWKEDCEKFLEYYQKRNPSWTLEQCKEAAKKFNRSINWQCVEFYQKKYPHKTLEECEKLRKEAISKKNKNHSFNIEYYRERYPEASEEELQKMLSDHAKSNNFQNIEYYRKRYPEASEEELQKMLSDAKKEYLKKRPDNSGENNPAHHSKTSELERRQRSPKCIEFYQKKYPGLTDEEYMNMVKEHRKLTASRLTPDKHSTRIEYWLAKGYSENEAIEKLSERQRTFTLQKCISKYGIEEGTYIFNKRQDKWKKSLMKNFQKYGDSRSSQSKFAYDLINEICKRLEINKPQKEKYMTDSDSGKHYTFDLCINNKLIEFNGDYWHCNPKLYKADFYNKSKQMTASDIWEYDKNKKECAEKNGYKVLYIWEYDYNNDRISTIKKCMEFLTS